MIFHSKNEVVADKHLEEPAGVHILSVPWCGLVEEEKEEARNEKKHDKLILQVVAYKFGKRLLIYSSLSNL